MDRGKYNKLLIFISTLLITSILFIIANTPISDGYEISIYRVFPWYFWLLVIISYIGCISITLERILNNENIDGYNLWVPILTMTFITSILLLMPLIRGYPTYGRGDVMGHIGYIKDILITGSFGENWYPSLHILGVSFSEITGINPKTLPMIFPLIFLLTFVIGIFYLVRELFNKKIGLIVLTISLIPLLGRTFIFFAPSQFSFVFLPLFLYIIFKSMKRTLEYSYLFIIILPIFIISHPHRTLFSLIIISLILFTLNYYKESDLSKHYSPVRGTFVIVVASLFWIIWYLLFQGAERTVSVLRTYLTGIYTGAQEEVQQITVEYSPPLIYYIRVGSFEYGIVGILSLLSIIFILIYSFSNFKILMNKKNGGNWLVHFKKQTNMILLIYIFFLILVLSFFFTGAPGGHGRLLVYLIFFSTILVAILLIFANKKDIYLLKIFSIEKLTYFFLIFLIILSVFSLYNSPWQARLNSQASDMEFTGMEWTFERRNESFLIEEMPALSQRRFHRAIYSSSAEEINIRKGRQTELTPHFGYEGNETLGSQYEEDRYLVISELNRIRYQELYPGWEAAQLFVEEDFEKLESDRTVNKIYSNGEFDSYYISSTEE